jgi:CheY-like chemotaxis protein
VFQLYVPAAEAALPAVKAAADPSVRPAAGTGQLVLIIDDESAVRNVLRALLEAHGYRAIIAADGTEGIALYRERGAEVAVVITDLMMPAMQGAEVISTLRSINPAARILAMSGLIEPGGLGVTPEPGRLELLPKPVTSQTLLKAVHQLLG